eukprot:326427-Lingulodinium_polyedra.AAC.1
MQGPSAARMHYDILEPGALLIGELTLYGEHPHLHASGPGGCHRQQVAVLARFTQMQRVTPAGRGGHLRRRSQGLYARFLHAPNVGVGAEQAFPGRRPA